MRHQIDGELTGEAKNIEVTLADGKVRVTGTGKGVIENALVAGFSRKTRSRWNCVSQRQTKIASVPLPSKILVSLTATAFQAAPAPLPANAPSHSPLFQPVRLVEWLPNATAWAVGRGSETLGKGLSIADGWLNHKNGAAQRRNTCSSSCRCKTWISANCCGDWR